MASSWVSINPANGNFGIGITNSSSNLDVNGTANFRSTMTYNGSTTNNFPISISGNANTANTATNASGLTGTPNISVGTIITTGNVGIGTATANGTLHLHSSTANSIVRIMLTDSTTGSANTNGVHFFKNASQDAILFNYRAASAFRFNIFNTEILTITSNVTNTGRVGINTSSPSYDLDVNGTTNFRSTITYQGSGANAFPISITGNANGLTGTPNISVGTIITSGNVGINTTSTGTSNLDVNGTANFRNHITITSNVGIGTSTASSNFSIFTTANNSSNQIFINSTSNFANIHFNNGIPASNAHIGYCCSNISGNYTCNLFLETTNSIILNAGAVKATASIPELIISSNGNVGINTNNPLSALDVRGLIYCPSNGSLDVPSKSKSLGGGGDRIVFYAGIGGTSYPYSIGIGTSSQWYSVPSGANHTFYVNGINSFNIDDTSISLNKNTTITQSLSASGATFAGNISTYAVTAYGNITINKADNPTIEFLGIGTTGYNIGIASGNGSFVNDSAINNMVIRSSSKLLLLSGTTSTAICIDTANKIGIGTTDPKTKLDVFGTINIGIGIGTSAQSTPTFASAYGGTGDRLILYPGTAGSIYPHSIGIGTSSLWYSVPSSSNHNFYVGGSSILQIASTGLIITGNVRASAFIENSVNLSDKYALKTDTPSLNNITGNVGIGTSASTRLYIYGTSTPLMTVHCGSSSELGGIVINNDTLMSGFITMGTSGQVDPIKNNLIITSANATLFRTGNPAVNSMFISSNGNVGIGRTDPVFNLDVNGTIYTNNILYKNIELSDYIFNNADTIINPIIRYPPDGYDDAYDPPVYILGTTSNFTTTVITYPNYNYGVGNYDITVSSWKPNASYMSPRLLLNGNNLSYAENIANGYIFDLTIDKYIYGNYSGNNYIVNGYLGAWVKIKFPEPIILRKFKFVCYATSRNNINSGIAGMPSAWKCYGSIDGISYTEIIEASNTNTEITSYDYYKNGGFYTYYINNSFNTQYNYIAWVFNKITDKVNPISGIHNFVELEIYSDKIHNDIKGIANISNLNKLGLPINNIYGGNGDRIILYKNSADNYPYSIGMNTKTMWFSVPTNGMYLWYSNLNSNMFLDATGSLNVYNDITGFNNASDSNLKTNIKPLNYNCTELINKFNPVEFTWKDIKDVPDNRKNKIDYGFIAQEIENLLPHIVKDTPHYKTIKYEKITPYLVKSIQELDERLKKIEEKLINI